MGIDANMLLAYLFGIILLYIAAKVLFIPIKFLFKFLANAVIGGVILWLINIFGGGIGIHVGINLITALVVALLGVPGVALLVVLQYIV